MGQKMLKRNSKPATKKTKVQERVASLPTPDLTSWAEQALFGIGRNIIDWGRYSDYSSLEEAKLGAEALLAVVEEIMARNSKTRNLS